MTSSIIRYPLAGFLALLGVFGLGAPSTLADSSVAPREGWMVIETDYAFSELAQRLNAAVKAEGMGLVTRASASEGAQSQGVEIAGNRVVGVYRNDFARRMLEASVAAGIEAPIRFYLSEDADGGATLSYKTPSFVFAPYLAEGGEPLRDLAGELDEIFAGIAMRATSD